MTAAALLAKQRPKLAPLLGAESMPTLGRLHRPGRSSQPALHDRIAARFERAHTQFVAKAGALIGGEALMNAGHPMAAMGGNRRHQPEREQQREHPRRLPAIEPPDTPPHHRVIVGRARRGLASAARNRM